MDSPGPSGWPSDLEDQVAELNTDRDSDQTTSLHRENGSVTEDYTDSNTCIASTSSMSEAQTQHLSQGFFNFSFFPSNPGGSTGDQQDHQDIIVEAVPPQQTTDIQTFTDALQQQLQGLSKDIGGWGSLTQKGNILGSVGTPSTVILSIDGAQQEIPISFHIDPATALGAAAHAEQEISVEQEQLGNTYDHFEDVTENYIKTENQSSDDHRQQYSDSPVKILTLTLEGKPQSDGELATVPEPLFNIARNLVTTSCEIIEEEPDIENSTQDKLIDSSRSVITQASVSSSTGRTDAKGETTSEAERFENVRKSSRLQEQVSVVRKKNQLALYNPEEDYNHQQLWCEDCQCSYSSECPMHKLVPVFDRAVLSRAWASLPPQLQIFRLTDLDTVETPELGVFSKKFIPSRTQFGPYMAETTDLKEEIESSNFLLPIEVDNSVSYLISSDENKCNWMMFVRAAECSEEQNMVAYQYADNIFFTTTRDVHPKEELKVWYAAHYANRFNMEVLKRKVIKGDPDLEGKFECYECEKRLKSMAQLQQHLSDVHDNEGGNEDSRGDVTMETNDGDEVVKRKNDGSSASFQSWKKTKRNLYFNKIKKYKEMRNRSTARKDTLKKVAPTFYCAHCALVFDSAPMLNIHTLMHAADRCETVPNEGENDALAQLSAAAAQLHSEAQQTKTLIENGLNTEQLKCPCCNQEFRTSEGLIQHTVVHAKSRKLRQNRRDRLYDPQKPYQCPDCIKSFATEDRLNRHRPVHSKDDSFKPLQCSECSKRFMSPPALACHMKTHSNEKYYTCPICREGFDQMHVLKQHGETHASNGIFPCPDCHKVFYDFNSVRKHMRMYHPYKELSCPLCPKLFPRIDKLKLHMLKHTDHKDYMCDQCGRQFKRKDKLREHSKRMHDPHNPKLKRQYNPEPKDKFIPKVPASEYNCFIYKCQTCLLGFKRRGMLVNHLAKRHPGTKPDSIPELNMPILKTQRDFFCQYCDKVYKSSSKRKAHILKAHPGADPPPGGRIVEETVQSVYGINCTTFSQLTGSVAATPHACQFCHKQYASKAKLLQHQRKLHPHEVPSKRTAMAAAKQVLGKVLESNGTHDLEEKIVELHDMSNAIIVEPEGQTADILTQAMSELTHSFTADYRSTTQQPQTPEQQRAKTTTEYQISLTGLGGADTGANQTAGIILQPTFVQSPVGGTPGTTAVDLSQILQEISAQEEGQSTALSHPIRIINGNQSQTLTVPLSFATQLLSRSIVQSIAK